MECLILEQHVNELQMDTQELMDGLKEFTGIEMDYMEFKKYCLRRIGF